MTDLGALLLAASLSVAAPAGTPVQGLPAQVTVRADRLEAGLDGAVMADGNVVLAGEGLTVRADHLEYDAAAGRIRLRGRVTVEEAGGGGFSAQSVELDANTLTGGIRAGVISPPGTPLQVRGELISRTGPEEYEVLDAVFTSCPGDCPDWSFRASEVRVRREGFLTARSVSFRILGVPVFYSPFLIYPVKTKRQSGLLIPEVRFTEDTGWEGAFPLFVTMGPTADATLTPRTFSRDATGLEGEVRYRLDLGGGGDWSGFTIGPEGEGRWYYRGDTAIPVTLGLWVRGRWYDAGDPAAPSDFGRTFDERHPGAVSRHAVLELNDGPWMAWAGESRILADAASARAETPGAGLDALATGFIAGPLRFGPGTAALGARWTRFEDGSDRLLVAPEAALRLPGPGPLAGRIYASAALEPSGPQDRGETLVLAGIEEGLSVGREFGWGRHRLDAGLSYRSATEARFFDGADRDAFDRASASSVLSANLRSVLSAGRARWEVTVTGWRDQESGEEDVFGSTRYTYRGLKVEGSYNRDGPYELVVPAPLSPSERAGDWSASLDLSGGRAGISLGRQAGGGTMDLSQAQFRVPLGRADLSGRVEYDGRAAKTAEASATLTVRGRCWTVGLTHGQSENRREWRLALSLE